MLVVKHLKNLKGFFDKNNKPDKMTKHEFKLLMNQMIQDQEVKQYVIKRAFIKSNLDKNFAIIWGQCPSGVQAALKGDALFEVKEEEHNCIWLLNAVKNITAGIDNKDNKQYVLHEALLSL